MVKAPPASVDAYLRALPPDRKEVMSTVRQMILKYLPKGYVETIQYGMIGYVVPLTLYADGYLGDKKTPLPFIGFASQKSYMSLYLMCVYGDPQEKKEFEAAYKKTGKKLNMGKSCLRFKKLEDLPLELIGKTIEQYTVKRYIEIYEAARKKKK